VTGKILHFQLSGVILWVCTLYIQCSQPYFDNIQHKFLRRQLKSKIHLNDIQKLIQVELEKHNRQLLKGFESDESYIAEIGNHIVKAGGKKLRPTVTILLGNAVGLDAEQVILLASIIEMIHIASLLHDDVIDHSMQRRGVGTSNAIWGNAAAVLAGDYIYSKSFESMIALDNIDVMRRISYTTSTISEGEIAQLHKVDNQTFDTESHLTILYKKTAILFETAAYCVALLKDNNPQQIANLVAFGRNFGLAFQIVDDILDYSGQSSHTGKAVGNDLKEGKVTLPLIMAYQSNDSTIQSQIKKALQSSNPDFDAILQILKTTNALKASQKMSLDFANRARVCIDQLPPSSYTEALHQLVDFCIDRQF